MSLRRKRLARAHLDPVPSRLDGRKLIFRMLRGAEQALGEGDEDSALRCLDETDRLIDRGEARVIDGLAQLVQCTRIEPRPVAALERHCLAERPNEACGLFGRSWRESLIAYALSIPVLFGPFVTFYCAARAFGACRFRR